MKIVKIVGIIVGVVMLGALGLLWHLTPILKPYPALSGPYAVGLRSYTFVDDARPMHESHTQEHRALPIDIYYPALGDTTKLYPYRPTYFKAFAHYQAKESHIPEFVWQMFVHGIKAHANLDAPINEKKSKYPVILFSPGIAASMTYAAYFEDLVSNGFIVVEVQHPYDLEVTVFPDGNVIEIDTAFATAIRKTDRDFIYPYRGRAHFIWLADLQFVLTQLEKLNNDSTWSLYQKLDLDRVGVLGNSHGGAVAIDLVKNDARVKAGINADGWTKTANTDEPFNKPFMFLWADVSGEHSGQKLYENMKAINNADAYGIVVPSASHGISDLQLLKWPLGHFCDNAIMHQTQTEIRKFFERYV